jgi:hypothetical protein
MDVPSHFKKVPSHIKKVPPHFKKFPSLIKKATSRFSEFPSRFSEVPSHFEKVPSYRNNLPVWKEELVVPALYRTMIEKAVFAMGVRRLHAAYGCPRRGYFGLGPGLRLGAALIVCQRRGLRRGYISDAETHAYSFSGLISLRADKAVSFLDDQIFTFTIKVKNDLRADKAISFLDDQIFTFTIKVENDGNSGHFPIRSADVQVVVYIPDGPDAPVLPADAFNFVVYENMGESQQIRTSAPCSATRSWPVVRKSHLRLRKSHLTLRNSYLILRKSHHT